MADYSAFTWVNDDGTGTTGTAINATRMNAIEAGIDDAAEHNKTGTAASRPAAASGNKNWIYYATDTAVTSISDGSTWATIASPVSTAIVSSLPGSPADGDVCYYQNSDMATAGVVWQLRYRSGGGTYKWEFIGGGPLSATIATSEATTSTSYTNLTTTGPSVTAPLAGDYKLMISVRASNNNLDSIYMSYGIAGAGALDVDAISTFAGSNATLNLEYTKVRTAAASDAFVAKYKTASGTSTFLNRTIALLPFHVG